MKKEYCVPKPMLNKKEQELEEFNLKRYEKMMQPSLVKKAGKKVSESIPESIRELPSKVAGNLPDSVKNMAENVTDAELLKKCIEVVSKSFSTMEKYASNATLSKDYVVNKVNALDDQNDIESLDEVCLVRVNEISQLVKKFQTRNFWLALAEGALTGVLGLPGIAPNLVLSTFIYYRAVQSVALLYGYDVKDNPSELMIATEVFTTSLDPSNKQSSELGNTIMKVMAFTQVTVVKQTAKKTWADMASKGGVCLMITQIRALANAAARKALEKVGKKGIEKSLFKDVFEQIGKKLTLKNTGKIAPGIGAILGAGFDSTQMMQIIEFADVFYSKRALIEKEARIDELLGGNPFVVDAECEMVD